MEKIIEPCCIGMMLPELMKQEKKGVFFSNGDWGVKKLMDAISLLADEDATVVLLMPSVDVYFCRVLADWFGRGWMNCLILATKEDCGALVANELKGYDDRVLYLCRKNLSIEAFVRYNEKQKFVVFGPMRVKGSGEFCQYSYVRGGSWDEFGEMVSPIVGLFVRKKKEGMKKCEGVRKFLGREFGGRRCHRLAMDEKETEGGTSENGDERETDADATGTGAQNEKEEEEWQP